MENFTGNAKNQNLSPWWRRGIAIILILKFIVLIWVTTGSYYRKSEPPVPEKVIDSSGSLVFAGTTIKAGQQVFLQKALMNNGTIWGHGAYMGPDFSAQYLHNLALEVSNHLAVEKYNVPFSKLWCKPGITKNIDRQ
jgi:nitric oxide reductase subunit B